ncbi:transposon Tn7 transposition protein TnsC [Lachnospiraceae bacterium]|nr:transposon Tn7 transposition protein TnsC [Lachnospiraceae bacterium]
MLKEKWNIVEKLPPMLSGEELKRRLEIKPFYDGEIRSKTKSERLVALNEIYSIYLPSVISEEIYSKIYLAMLRSLQKKEGKLAIQQRNENGKRIRGMEDSVCGYQGIIGGSDSFTIIGSSGIGKSSAISRAITIATENSVIEMEEPFCKIIPAVVVQCPFDCSVKSLLLQILRQIDMELDTHYYDMAVRARATTDMLIGSVSQIALNHIGLLVVDEIQNIVNHRQGKSLVGMLTQLINNSGISICMVGTPEAEVFFESVDYLARRALGLRYGSCEYNAYFREFCIVLFQYQYIQEESDLSDSIIQWLYEHSAGVLAVVVSLIHDAQEISILNGRELLDMVSLNEAYEQRMNMLHSHIRPSVVIKKDTVKRKKGSSALEAADNSGQEERQETGILSQEADSDKDGRATGSMDKAEDNVEPVTYSADKGDSSDWTFMELAEQAKKNHCDMLSLLKGKISITEVAV